MGRGTVAAGDGGGALALRYRPLRQPLCGCHLPMASPQGGLGWEAWVRQTSKVTVRKARGLRRVMSPPEVLLWQRLRLRPGGVKFRRQHPGGVYVADFYAAEGRVIVEVDGVVHDFRVERDGVRDEWLRGQGFVVVRVAAVDVLKDVEAVVDGVVRVILASR